MAMLMRLCGIILAAIGLALTVMSIASPSQMQVYGLTPETGAILLVGGILSLGLSALIDRGAELDAGNIAAPSRFDDRNVGALSSRGPDAGFGRSAVVATSAAAATTVAVDAATKVSPETISETLSGAKTTVSETIEALEQAKSDIKAALGGSESFDSHVEKVPLPEAPSNPPVIAPTPEPLSKEIPIPAAETVEISSVEVDEEVEEPASEPGLFVVEEQTVRGKPARLLSDGTVEAETDEGWMRFENLEHLNEYLDMLAQS
jgi:cell division septation protein DedD